MGCRCGDCEEIGECRSGLTERGRFCEHCSIPDRVTMAERLSCEADALACFAADTSFLEELAPTAERSVFLALCWKYPRLLTTVESMMRSWAEELRRKEEEVRTVQGAALN